MEERFQRWTRPRVNRKSSFLIALVLVLWSVFILTFLTKAFIDLPQKLNLSQRCRMSRMWPSYVLYKPDSPSGLDTKYRLFLYREATPGRSIDADQPKGRPALFVPGNAGSFGQVRSVASSAHHLFHSGQAIGGADEVDWWTVDFNEDFSAFHGETMQDQATYINEVISFLLKKYPSARQVPVLGHSMGGIVARLMMLKDNHPFNSVNTIITLSSPHAYPPVPFDKGVERVYSLINSMWHEQALSTLLISLSGGILDNQLSSEPSSLPLARIWYKNTSLSAFTASLSGLWSGVDHLAMMWCDQLRERLARGVLNIEGQEKPIEQRREEWRRLLGISAEENSIEPFSSMMSSDTHGQAEGLLDGPDNYEYTVSNESFDLQGAFNVFTSLAVGLDTSYGPPIDQQAGIRVALCITSGECRYVLPSAYDLYPPSVADESFPRAEERYEVPGKGIRRLTLHLEQLLKENIKIIRIEKRDKISAKGLLVAGWSRSSQIIHISPHVWLSSEMHLRKGKNLTSTSIDMIVYGMDSSLFAYDLTFLPASTKDSMCQAQVLPMIKIQSLSTGDTQYYPGIQDKSKYTFTLHATSPYMPPALSEESATKFSILLDTCGQIDGFSIRINWRASAALLVSRYRTILGAFPLAIVMFTSSLLWHEWDQGGQFRSLTDTLMQTAPLLLSLLLSFSMVLSLMQKVLSQFYQHVTLQNLSLGLPNSSILLHLLLHFIFVTCSFGITIMVSIILDVILKFTSTLFKLVYHNNKISSKSGTSAHFLYKPKATLISFGVLTTIVWLAVPVQLVFLVLFLIQFFSTTLAVQQSSRSRSESSQYYSNQQVAILNLFFWLLPFNIPVLLIWSRNILRGYHGFLAGPDHNIFSVIGFLCITQISTNGRFLHRSKYRITSLITSILFISFSVYSLAYGIRYTHRLFPFANIILTWLALQQYSIQIMCRLQPEDVQYSSTRKESDEVEDAIDTQIASYSNVLDQIAEGMDLPEKIKSSLIKVDGYTIPNNSIHKKDKDLDLLLERYLDLLDDYFNCKNEISSLFAGGSFQLSKAKMQLGRVTSFNDMWDARMKAGLIVILSQDSKMAELRHQDYPQFSDEQDDGMDLKDGILIETKEKLTSLRSRKYNSKLSSQTEVQDEEFEIEKEGKDTHIIRKKKKKAQSFNSLYQFAPLPPPSLRKAQTQFTQMLEGVIGTSNKPGLFQIEAELKDLESRILSIRMKAQKTN